MFNALRDIIINAAKAWPTYYLRIDSPMLTIVSTCVLSVYDGKKTTYGADWGATGVALGADWVSLVQILVQTGAHVI